MCIRDRNWTNTKILDEYCEQAGLYPVFRHSNSITDYTHHLNMKHFSHVDHFLVSEQLYQTSLCKQFVIHDVDNTSDHDPLCLHLTLSVHQMMCSRVVRPKPFWDKASDTHIVEYKNVLRSQLNSIKLPHCALLCRDVCCISTEHIHSLNAVSYTHLTLPTKRIV